LVVFMKLKRNDNAPPIPSDGLRASSGRSSSSFALNKVPTTIVAVGGGKGGIGKSLVSANLACSLAKLGASVVLLDADLGGANLHTCLGIAQPRLTLSDFIERRVAKLDDVAVETGIEGVRLVSGALDSLEAANPKHAQKTKLIRQLRSLSARYVLLDLGAGTSLNVLDFFLAADIGIAVLLPEPTSVENGYRFLKAAFMRKLGQLVSESSKTASQAGEQASLLALVSASRSPTEAFAKLAKVSPQLAEGLEAQLKAFRPQVVVNQVRSDDDRQVGSTVLTAWKKFFGLELGFLGTVEFDELVLQAVRSRASLTSQFPFSDAAKALDRLALNLDSLTRETL
jgi:flagellar biosynthesis protein FlhG